MTESENPGVQLFSEIQKFWEGDDHRGLSEIAIGNIGRVLEYVNTPEGNAAVALRAEQLDQAISRFNELNESEGFVLVDPDQKESQKLAKEVLERGEKFPLLKETPLDTKAVLPYLVGFRRLAGTYSESGIHYYTFLDKKEVQDKDELNFLITGLLVDGFAGFAFRAKKVAAGKPSSVGRSDLTAVNAICEMVRPGELQTEMYKANWYKPDYGLDPEFCKKIADQFN